MNCRAPQGNLSHDELVLGECFRRGALGEFYRDQCVYEHACERRGDYSQRNTPLGILQVAGKTQTGDHTREGRKTRGKDNSERVRILDAVGQTKRVGADRVRTLPEKERQNRRHQYCTDDPQRLDADGGAPDEHHCDQNKRKRHTYPTRLGLDEVDFRHPLEDRLKRFRECDQVEGNGYCL